MKIKNKYLFFLTRFLRDMSAPRQWKISSDLHSKKLTEYYFLFDEMAVKNQKGGQKSIVSDENGIPRNPTYIDVTDKDYVYFPITIGQVGLAVFHTYLASGSEYDKDRFLKFIHWFAKHGDYNKHVGLRWMTDVALPQYHHSGPWQSAFAQSRGISILLRGFQLTGNEYYAELAEQALQPFTLSVQQGGVTSLTQWGPFYEEYTSPVPTLVLNGMIFSLCGIYDFVRVFPEHQKAKKLFEQGIATLECILPHYDLRYWSRYNLCDASWYPSIDPATITYQHLHVTQLAFLWKLTRKEIFRTYSEKFKKQLTFMHALRMYKTKYAALKKIGRL